MFLFNKALKASTPAPSANVFVYIKNTIIDAAIWFSGIAINSSTRFYKTLS